MIRPIIAASMVAASSIAASGLMPAAAHAAVKRTPTPPPPVIAAPQPQPALPPASRDEPLPPPYADMVRQLTTRGPADTLGDGLFALGEAAFRRGSFEEAMNRFQEFARRFTRNLNLNDALERILLIKEMRDFEDEPLSIYARAEGLRAEGFADSAAVLLRSGLARYPGARLRYHFRYALAEIARDRGDHPAAIEQAVAVADTSSKSRLAPYALKLAGDEVLAMNGMPERAAAYYQALLERYPDSPLAAGVRAQVLALRKRMQL